jgi:type IV pilus assembly protein PilB
VSLADREIDHELIHLVPYKVLRKHHVVPISRRGSTITVATADGTNIFAADELKFITGYNVELVVARYDEIETMLDHLASMPIPKVQADEENLLHLDEVLSNDDGETLDDDMIEVGDFQDIVSDLVDDIEVVEEDDDDPLSTNVEAPIIKLVNSILLKAVKMKVSDIHVEPFEKFVRVRYRLDGVLRKVMTLPAQVKNPIISRFKVMAHLDIAERRLPQDGRIRIKMGRGREMDFRVSCLPTIYGEKIVLRLLDKSNLQLDMTKLGFEPDALETFRNQIHQPWGMVLVTGPTGSGKTTTLYSALAELNDEDTNIMTAEDPVEYNLVGINQVQMSEAIGLNFASALRSFLRQDPDVILVGEIRDFETAEIAIKAALTGHLVLSTLHTNDAPSTVNRLVNMGIEPFLVSSSVNLILAQRLARKVCDNCKEPVEHPSQALEDLGLSITEIETTTIYRGKGCQICSESGCKGRVAFYEVMDMVPELKELIIVGATAAELQEKAVELGMDTLRMAGVKKMMQGMVSMEEVLRITKTS